MSTTTSDPLVDSYLKRLHAKARSLPRSCREELIEQIEEHLREALPGGQSEAEVRNVLEQLGDPDDIVAEEFERLGIRRARAGKLEWAVVFLLPFGSVLVIPLLGWILGVILLWASRIWTTREKVIGTLLPPGGLSAVLIFALIGIGTTCTSRRGPAVVGPANVGFAHVRVPVHAVVERCTAPAIPNPIGTVLLVLFVIAGIVTPIFLARRASAART